MNRKLGRQSSREAISNPDTGASCIRASPSRVYTPDAPIRPRPYPWGVPGKQRAKGKRRTLTIVARDHKRVATVYKGFSPPPPIGAVLNARAHERARREEGGGCPTFALNPGFLD